MDFSGLERDKLFLSDEGKTFVDISYLSGTDNVQDGRSFAYSDLNHDGVQDIILLNRNAPILVIYEGKITRGNWIGLQLTGDGRRSNRDAVGTRVQARCKNNTITRIVEIGAGFGIQNSKALTVGIGACESVEELIIQWPGGTQQSFKNLSAQTFFELTEGGTLKTREKYYSKTPLTSRTVKTAAAK